MTRPPKTSGKSASGGAGPVEEAGAPKVGRARRTKDSAGESTVPTAGNPKPKAGQSMAPATRGDALTANKPKKVKPPPALPAAVKPDAGAYGLTKLPEAHKAADLLRPTSRGSAGLDDTSPVFILAAPRSYSSLVNAMIGQHPALYGVPELNLFQCETVAEFTSGLTSKGQKKSPFWKTMRHGLLRTIAQVFAGEQSDESIRMAERWLKMRESFSPADVLHEIADAVAPLRVVEKSPGVLRHRVFMDRMLEAFPKARFIHLLRHPIPQGESVLKAKGGVGVLLALNSVDQLGVHAALEPQIAWHDAQVQILRFLDNVPSDQLITLRGEDLMNDMAGTLPAVCRWLGISDAPEAVEAMRHPENSVYSCMGPLTAPLGNDVNFLKSPKLRGGQIKVPPLDAPVPWRADGAALHPRVQDLARALGY